MADVDKRLAEIERQLIAFGREEAENYKRIEEKLDAIISFFGIDKRRLAPCQVQQMASDDVQEFLRRELQRRSGKAGRKKQSPKKEGP